jgi:hypothetical protein
MNMYAAGKNLGQKPSQFLLFQHFVIGLGLKFFYEHCPQVPWYGALLYIYLFVSSLLIGYALLRMHDRLSTAGVWVALFLIFYLQVIVSPQFTVCAGYLAIAGILVLYSAVSKPYASRNANRWWLCLGMMLLIWAGLVRFYSLLLVMFSMVPLYGVAFVRRRADAWRGLFPILFLVALASVFLNWTQVFYYEHSPGWEQFYRYNNVRAEYIDRHKIAWNKSTAPLFQRIGWSRNDLEMLTSWFYLDPNVYSFNNLVFISQNSELLPKAGIDWDSLFTNLLQSLRSYSGMGGILLCIVVLARNPMTTQGFAVFALVWYGILFTGISLVERHLPLRVWLVMLCSFYATEAVLWCQAREEMPEGSEDARPTHRLPILSRVIVALFLALCVGQLKINWERSNRYRLLQREFRHDLEELKPRADQLFVTWGGDFPYQTFQLPDEATPASQEMQFLGLGVGNHEPVVQNRLRSFGINDLYQAFYQRNDVLLICIPRKRKLLEKYIQEHYHEKVLVRTVFKGKTFTVCKVAIQG